MPRKNNDMQPIDFETLAETTELECKAAQGRDGKGEIPASVWESYSAMANTRGGEIFLGVEETNDYRFVCKGIRDIEKLHKAFWDTVNAGNLVNRNILSEDDVRVLKIDDMSILHISVPRARRQDRPIHLKTNPFGNTFLRRHQGDYRADDETVRRMLAEAVSHSRDDQVLEDYGLDDLDIESVNAYRNRFSAIKPNSPWLGHTIEEFLVCIGAMERNKKTKIAHLRLAGLLMFGRFETIVSELPNYMLDYQERVDPELDVRWIDRLIPDSTWSGNLFDFYHKVIRKLTADLKIPFKLKGFTRVDDTPVHEALREALTNTLIHADYTGRMSVQIIKQPNLFRFRNSGLMRISIERAFQGGDSDCRNRHLQSMFRYIGLGEHAGSGIPRITKAWQGQHWRYPSLIEDADRETTVLELRTSSLLPEDSVQAVSDLFGSKFNSLNELERIILVTAHTEHTVSHKRIRELSDAHPNDISKVLTHLVQEKYLLKHGETRGAYYLLSGVKPVESTLFPEELSSPHLDLNSPHLEDSSPHLNTNSPHLRAILDQELQAKGYTSMPRKINPTIMKQFIVRLCQENWITLIELSKLLERDPKALLDRYLTIMVKDGLIRMKYPQVKNHPNQAYGAGHDH